MCGHRQCWDGHFWRRHTSRGQNEGKPPKEFQIFWSNIFLKSSFEKSNTFWPLLNTYFRVFSDLLSCGSLGPPPPGDKGLKKSEKIWCTSPQPNWRKKKCLHQYSRCFGSLQYNECLCTGLHSDNMITLSKFRLLLGYNSQANISNSCREQV